MTDKAAGQIKNLIGGYFALIGLGCVVLFFYVLFSTPDLIDRWRVIGRTGPGLLFLILVFGALGYGLFSSRRWVVWLHGIILTVWLVSVLSILYTVWLSIWHERSFEWLLILVFSFVIPIAIQAFLLRFRRRIFNPGPRLSIWGRISVTLAGLFGLSMMFPLAIAVTLAIAIGPTERRLMGTAENEYHRVTAFYYPGIWVTDMPTLVVVHEDKESWIGGETIVWSSRDTRSPDTVCMSLTTTDSLQIITYRVDCAGLDEGEYYPMNSIVVDLKDELSYPIGQIDDASPRYHSEIDYDGCVDVDTTENERFQVIHRVYPSMPGKYGGKSRLILVDKDEWFEDEKILAEALEEDSIMMRFMDENSLRVVLHKYDPTWSQYRQLNEIDRKTYRLDQFDGREYDYTDRFDVRIYPYITEP